jgi:prepilin-type N-terminal cleavage/methylation domain-containing protein
VNRLNSRDSHRPGFTLIELLVVIAIIALLMALLAAAIIRMLGVVPQRNTELEIAKLAFSLEQQWTRVINQCRTEPKPPATWALAQVQAGNADPGAIMLVYTQWRLVQEFPMNFNQALNPPGGLPMKPIFLPLQTAVAPPATAQGNDFQSSICLYLAMTSARGGMEFDTSSLSAKEARQVIPNIFALFDGWDQPIQFDNGGGVQYKIASAGSDRTLNTADDILSTTLRIGK